MKDLMDDIQKLFDSLISDVEETTTENHVRPIIIEKSIGGGEHVRNYETASYLMEGKKLIDFRIITDLGTINSYQRDTDGDFILIDIRDADGKVIFQN